MGIQADFPSPFLMNVFEEPACGALCSPFTMDCDTASMHSDGFTTPVPMGQSTMMAGPGRHPMQEQASCSPTPMAAWSKTPSPPSTPLYAWRGALPNKFPVAYQTVCVTVPVSLADTCPHCGRMFSLATATAVAGGGTGS